MENKSTAWNGVASLACVLLVVLCLPPSHADGEADPIVVTHNGAVNGTSKFTDKGRRIEAFLAIPYAKPPVGPLRFKNPEPSEPWTGVRDGTKEPNLCVQNEEVNQLAVVGDEDCLYLNVYTPSSAEKGKYPVMLFIHGGGFVNGGGQTHMYGPQRLLNKDVVLVTIHYRLGFLGFGSTEDAEIPGNFGLKDQALAIKWVNENIAAFGGDQQSITIFGESAGAAGVHFQALAPQNAGLFKRVIPMSGSVDCPWAISPPGYVAEQTRKAGEMLNCSTASSKELVSCLRTIPASVFPTILNKFVIWDGQDPIIVFNPVFEPEGVESSFITRKSFKQRSALPMMIGVTEKEGAFKVALLMSGKGGFESILSEHDKRFTEITPVAMFFNESDPNPTESAAKIKDYYFGSKAINNDSISELIDLYTDSYFLQGATESIRKHEGSSFVYKFEYKGDYSTTQALTRSDVKFGASHGDDLMYLFPIQQWRPSNLNFTNEDQHCSDLMVELYTNFATYGNPTPGGKPVQWNSVSLQNLDYLSIKNNELKMENNFPTKRDTFWQTLTWRKNLIP